MQGATRASADAVTEIGRTIQRLNEISSGITSALQQQGQATSEISRNVQQAAAGAREVSRHVDDARTATDQTGQATRIVLDAAGHLTEEARQLREEVDRFLREVRAS